MMLMKNIILSALFASVSCYEFKNFKLSSTNPPITHTNMAQLFELCFANTSNPIVITENLVETFHKNMPITIRAPVVIINKNFIRKNIQLYYPTHPMYILSVSSYGEMFELLQKLIHLPFWSQKSIFFVIFETTRACERSWEMIYALSMAELLSCIIVCSRTGNTTSLYTYNPFTRRAPNPWVEVNFDLVDWRGRPLTLYNQSFSNDHKICETLLFDKTKFLDGYPVIIAAQSKLSPLILNYTFTSLNMTQKVINLNSDDSIHLSVINRVCDISQLYSPNIDPRIVHTVPVITEKSYIIVTKKASYLSAVYEIAHVFDINGAIAIIFLLLLITLLIVLHNKYQVGLAVLDVLKLLMSMGIDAPLDRLAMKITFFTGFLFVFLFSPLIEGQLFAVLSRPPTYNMESLKDLYDHKYHVYCPEIVHKYILEEQLWKTDEDMKYLHIATPYNNEIINCFKQVFENKKVACIFEEVLIIDAIVIKNLHISKRFMLKRSGFYQARKFWALADRFYHKSLNIQEAGIELRMRRQIGRTSRKKLKAKERLKRIADYQEIDAVDLTYLYVFMAFFQFLAVIVFGIEYIVGRYRRPRQ
ncbi:uncharacterized protein LOC130677280 [Microplitis mediator]|uniref:uncharacterized protein LOC130677280 n=1 Tax=Microplitis mediator TaxID=375433 RepID=UPI002556EF44|nr:uncharacterized protein LOC130677280 [Microplitis mediator]